MTETAPAPAATPAAPVAAATPAAASPPAPAPEAPPPAPRPDAVPTTMDLLADVEIEVTVELGRRRMSLGEVSRLTVGSVVELDTLAGEPLAIYANGRRVATGEAVVVEGQFGVRVHRVGAG